MWWQSTIAQYNKSIFDSDWIRGIKVKCWSPLTSGISPVVINSFMGVKKMMDKNYLGVKMNIKWEKLSAQSWVMIGLAVSFNTKINSLCRLISFKLQNNIRTFGKFATRSSWCTIIRLCHSWMIMTLLNWHWKPSGKYRLFQSVNFNNLFYLQAIAHC